MQILQQIFALALSGFSVYR